MRTSTKPRTPHHVATLLALAGVAAGVSGSAWRAPGPQAIAPLALAKPALAPAVVAATSDAAPAAEAVMDAPAQVAAAAAPLAARPVVSAGPVSAEPVSAAPVEAAIPAAAAAPVAQTVALATPAPNPAAAPAHAVAAVPTDLATLRSRLHWLSVQVDGRMLRTPDPDSRLLLARSAAQRAGLAEVGLDFRDVYGVITAETSWVARTGMGRNGVASQGLAQLEPATARALGVRDANDPVEAVHGAAKLLKEAAGWSARRIAGLGLSGAERAARLREGISVYYNLSTRARQHWNGMTHNLPLETRRHISNVRAGIAQAERLETGSGPSAASLVADAAASARASAAPVQAAPVQRIATRHAAPAVPHALGTISWSGKGGDAEAGERRAGTHVVWSDGAVTRQGGRVHWTSSRRG